jgi:hypothetical protein
MANIKHVWQWFWGHDWLGNKVKNIYFGPRLDWMKLFKKEKKNVRNKNKKKKKQKQRNA